MAESREANEFESTFEFFILSGLSGGPQPVVAIQGRVSRAEKLLQMAAARKGVRGHGALRDALGRLQREGSLTLGHQSAELPEEAEVYGLTPIGQERLTQERARLNVELARFVEGADLDRSFRGFLDRSQIN